MGVQITQESDYGKELAKWEQFPTLYAPTPGRPYKYNEFPRMLYKARRRPDGKVSTGEVDDGIFGGHPGSAEAWSRGCQHIVNNDAELEEAVKNGWRKTPKEALAYDEELQRFVETAAAHRAYEDRNMSEKAKAEAAEAESKTMDHLPEIPEQPRAKRKYTRRAKVA